MNSTAAASSLLRRSIVASRSGSACFSSLTNPNPLLNTISSQANEGTNTWVYSLAHRFFHSNGKNSAQVPSVAIKKKQYVNEVVQKEKSPQSSPRATNICVKLKSYDQPFLENWELPPSSKQIGLPRTRVLYTVLRSPHIDKKSREQFEMRINKKVIKMETNDLQKKFFWLKRQRIFGAQCEIVINCKTRLDKKRLQSLL